MTGGESSEGTVVEEVGRDEVREDPTGPGMNFVFYSNEKHLSNGKSLGELRRDSDMMSFTFCRDYPGCCM